MGNKRIGILTGGGDVPGLNTVIKSVVYRGAELGCEVIGIRHYLIAIGGDDTLSYAAEISIVTG